MSIPIHSLSIIQLMFHLPTHEAMRLGNDMKETANSVNIDGIPGNSPLFTAVQFIEFLDVFLADLETKHIDIGAHTVRILRLGEGDETDPSFSDINSQSECKRTHAGGTNE